MRPYWKKRMHSRKRTHGMRCFHWYYFHIFNILGKLLCVLCLCHTPRNKLKNG
jgi:hypothetical protein